MTAVVRNKTEREFTELYVFSQEEAGPEKEKNVLSQQACLIWEEGRSITILFQGKSPWIIRGVDSDGNEIFWRNVYASSNRSLILRLFADQPEVLEQEP